MYKSEPGVELQVEQLSDRLPRASYKLQHASQSYSMEFQLPKLQHEPQSYSTNRKVTARTAKLPHGIAKLPHESQSYSANRKVTAQPQSDRNVIAK